MSEFDTMQKKSDYEQTDQNSIIHIKEQDLNLFVDLLLSNKTNEISGDIKYHIENCLECKTYVLDLIDYYEN